MENLRRSKHWLQIRSCTHESFSLTQILRSLILMFICFQTSDRSFSISSDNLVSAIASINYGVSQEPITDVNLLMPKLCQIQGTICEGSFCIPGVKKCVCDLRMPVLFGRYCLRQLDIGTNCFATNQCNHTVREAVCIDINSNAVLDAESSNFKLDQWQQLNELRQQSQSSQARELPEASSPSSVMRQSRSLDKRSNKSPLYDKFRNSPYEINYNTAELLLQNHTRRNYSADRGAPNLQFRSRDDFLNDWPESTTRATQIRATTVATLTTLASAESRSFTLNRPSTSTAKPSEATQGEVSSSAPEQSSRKKSTAKSFLWPPGVCSCPRGSMFNSMLRKCIAMSLAESHCVTDSDCRQFAMTHCASLSARCECDEPLVWNQSELACARSPEPASSAPSLDQTKTNKKDSSLPDGLLPPLILAKLLPDQSMMLLIFVVLIIAGTLILLQLVVKCFSPNKSALISPKSKSRRKKKRANEANLATRSPFATLRRPEHKPSSELSNFSQATRGRILNYDFEQEAPANGSIRSPSPPSAEAKPQRGPGDTLRLANKGHQHSAMVELKRGSTKSDDEILELTDDISLSQPDSEAKGGGNGLAIPGPPPSQQPPYMLTSSMKGQGSAIAAAAAAVANKKIQMAQKKSLEPAPTSGRQVNGSPVFL